MELPNRLSIEQSFATRLLGLSRAQRNRIMALAGWPPDLNKIPDYEWQRIERENREKLAAILLLIWLASAELHGADVKRGSVWLAGHDWASQHSITLASQLNETTRTVLARVLASSADITKAVWAAALDMVFGEERAEKIAITEVTNAQTAAGEAVMPHSENDIWWTEADERVCPKCAPLHKTGRPTWEAAYPNGPPAHVACRCWIQYVTLAKEDYNEGQQRDNHGRFGSGDTPIMGAAAQSGPYNPNSGGSGSGGSNAATGGAEFGSESNKVVDQAGKSIDTYHGTPHGEFNAFDSSRMASGGGGEYGAGFYFSENKDAAKEYTGNPALQRMGLPEHENGRVFTANLNITRPFDFDAKLDAGTLSKLGGGTPSLKTGATGEDWYRAVSKEGGKAAADSAIRSAGFNGASYSDSEGNRNWIAFDAKQITVTKKEKV